MTEPALAPAPGGSVPPGPPPAASPAPGPRPRSAARRLGRLLLAAASGGVLALAFPGSVTGGLWPLAPLSVALLALAARGVRPRAGALLGLVAGLAFFVPHLEWSGIYVGALPWFALATVESLYLAAMGALLPLAWRAPLGRVGTSVSIAGLWVLQEAIRGSWPFGGFPWGRLAFSQEDAPTLGLAAIGGAPLVTFAVALAGAAAACAVVALARRRVLGSALAVLGVAAVLGGGIAVPRPTDGEDIRVAAVQGNVPRAGLDFNAERRAVLDNHARATRDLAARVEAGQAPAPDLVLWPENASDIDPYRNPDAYSVIDSAVRTIGVPTLVGTVLREPVGYVSNTAIVWSPQTGPGAEYVKQHPVPFGEYIPYRSFFRRFSDKVDLVATDFYAGDRTGILDMGAARIADVICFEVAYDELVAEPVRQGADLVVVQTNNATFGRSAESVQQLAMSRLRAVETGRSVVHISTVGISAIIEPDGSVSRRSGHFTQEVLEADIPRRTEMTVATRLGEVPEWTLAGAGLVLALGGAAGRRVRRRDGGRTT